MTEEKSVRRKALGRAIRPYLLISPSITIFLVFMIYPVIYMIFLSFHKWDMMGEKIYIGLQNYVTLLTDRAFTQIIGNTFGYMVLTVVLTIVLALLLALFLKKSSRFNSILQSAIFTPYIISFVSISFIWMWMMDSSYGLFNYLLGFLNVPPVRWLEDPKTALLSLVLVAVWKGVGYNTIIFISGMQSIPGYLYEAASLDKANRASLFLKITLPMLSPTLFFLTLVNIISSLKVFETVSIMTKGGPSNATNTLVYYIYEYGFNYYKIGYSSAVGVVLMLIIGVMTMFYFKALGAKVHYR